MYYRSTRTSILTPDTPIVICYNSLSSLQPAIDIHMPKTPFPKALPLPSLYDTSKSLTIYSQPCLPFYLHTTTIEKELFPVVPIVPKTFPHNYSFIFVPIYPSPLSHLHLPTSPTFLLFTLSLSPLFLPSPSLSPGLDTISRVGQSRTFGGLPSVIRYPRIRSPSCLGDTL